MFRKICISAYNIHQGGGKVVLLAFLKEKIAENNKLTCFIDERLIIDFDEYKSITFIKVKPTLKGRLLTEYKYKGISKNFDIFYFLGNLPPLFKLNCRVVLFLQNRLMISWPFVSTLSIKTIIRSAIETAWFRLFLENINVIEVQTASMKKMLLLTFPSKEVHIHNYIDYDELKSLKKKFDELKLTKEKNSFVYVTSTNPHKNLHRLIIAFANIGQTAKYCLYLTIDEKSKYVDLAKKHMVHIKCIESTEREDVLKQVYCSEYLIFPSLIESLGLPLIEAEYMGTKIIASDLDFVFDVCKPAGTFDPLSVESITARIKKTLKSQI